MPATTSTDRRYGGKTGSERRSERQGRLLDAGLELFGTKGYAATTIEGVCAAARLHPRYFYEAFSSRQALLGAVYDRHIATITSAVLVAVDAAPAEPRPRLEAGLRAFLAALLADPRAARVNYFEMIGVSAELERKRRAVLGAYEDLIAGEIAAARRLRPISVPDDRLAAVGLVGAVDGLIMDQLSRETPDADAVVATVLTIVEAILSG